LSAAIHSFVVGDIPRRCAIEVETRPHGARHLLLTPIKGLGG